MLGTLLITLREGLEAALVVAIILAYLARTGHRPQFRQAWLGTGLGILVSLIVGAAIYLTVGELTGRNEQLFEGATTFLAAGVLTWMIFWMRQQASDIRGHLQAQIESALGSGSSLGLVVLTFVAVVREGIELVLFLFAATTVAASPLLSTVGGLIGLAIAVVLGYSFYKGTSRLNLRTFFNVTSALLILFAAGLLTHGIGEFHELGIIPPVVERVWNTSAFISEPSLPGQFLTALFGYNASPSLIEVIIYFAYLIVAFAAYFRPTASKTA